MARSKVAFLRAPAVNPDDPYLLELVRELMDMSPEFRRIWKRHDVLPAPPEWIQVHHADMGDLTLHPECFTVNSAPGQRLIVYQAEPDSDSERTLKRLCRLATEIRAEATSGSIRDIGPPAADCCLSGFP